MFPNFLFKEQLLIKILKSFEILNNIPTFNTKLYFLGALFVPWAVVGNNCPQGSFTNDVTQIWASSAPGHTLMPHVLLSQKLWPPPPSLHDVIFENRSSTMHFINGMLRHSLGGAVIFISLQHFILPYLIYCPAFKPEVRGIAIRAVNLLVGKYSDLGNFSRWNLA